MPELKIKLSDEVHEKLKEQAKANYRSLTNYITVELIKLAKQKIEEEEN